MKNGRYVHLFFLDGVGLGGDDPAVNPFVTAHLPHLTGLLGAGWYLSREPIVNGRASLVPTDANLGLPNKPQSATGQATILTGRNVPQLVGEHYGPKPNPAVQAVIAQGTLFREVVQAGGQAALITPYPQGYFDAVARGKRLLSAVPLAATEAGLALMNADDLRNGRAVSPGFTGQAWREHLGYTDIPLLTLAEAGQQIAHVARHYQFSFFEHWPSDQVGHRGTLAEAVAHLEAIDEVLGGLLAAWDDENGLFILTSDHGNIEEKNQRQHTRNPVPTLLVGPGHAELASQIYDLRDIAKITRTFLGLPARDFS
ncbi:MAG: alkaline phosphatase family protein [Anaerolineaceae bacterium]|nr:alkaline phosphatase family protein [Anaerolineaceae bacterium]